MSDPFGEFLVGAFGHALADEGFRFFLEFEIGGGIGKFIDATFPNATPAGDPIEDIKGSVVTELDVGGEDAFDPVSGFSCEEGAFGLGGDFVDHAIICTAPKVAEEKLSLIFF